jgi:hypothetical protein
VGTAGIEIDALVLGAKYAEELEAIDKRDYGLSCQICIDDARYYYDYSVQPILRKYLEFYE